MTARQLDRFPVRAADRVGVFEGPLNVVRHHTIPTYPVVQDRMASAGATSRRTQSCAYRLLASQEPPSSLAAFVVASVARAAAAHPDVHAYRNWRGQLVTHRHVDVTTIIEIPTPQGPFGLPHVLRDTDIRDVPDLSAELHRVKREPSASGSGRWLERAAPVATHIPGAIEAMYAVMARSVAVRQRVGTVAVTAVGMFASGGGFGLTPRP